MILTKEQQEKINKVFPLCSGQELGNNTNAYFFTGYGFSLYGLVKPYKIVAGFIFKKCKF